MHNEDACSVLDQPAFSNTHPMITVLSGQWTKGVAGGSGAAYTNDVSVTELIAANNENKCPDRLATLLHILDINLNWRMHVVSDGQRRRVQILMALLKPFEVLLLDEVTVDLDVVARADFLDFLKMETETRGATVLYATHIFDGLDEWASHLAYMTNGKVERFAPVEEYEDLKEIIAQGSISPLLDVIEKWLRAERLVLKAKMAEKASVQAVKEVPHYNKRPKANAADPFGGRRQVNYW